ncbi:MAG: metallophosphoesterase [Lentisphaeria bacterium]|nr:metallophosphoesterase [Lentisphaeria bacterium]
MAVTTNKRIWVIGDIHGMYDPLVMLINHIRHVKYQTGEAAKLIFLGDYIDRGPCPKAVVDLILSLKTEFEVVCLAGNHEDMLLQFYRDFDLSRALGNPWFAGNGGQQTLCAFINKPEVFQALYQSKNQHIQIHPNDYPLPDPYGDFFANLRYAHTEVIEHQGRQIPFAFTHASLLDRGTLPIHIATSIPDITPEEQLALVDYDRFHRFRYRWDIWISHLHLWNRDIPKEKFGDYLLIHGHTPTPALVGIPELTGDFDPASSLPFVNFPGGDVEVKRDQNTLVFSGGLDDIISINIDTGAAYGKALTAVSLHPVDLFDHHTIRVIQSRMDRYDRATEQAVAFDFAFQP